MVSARGPVPRGVTLHEDIPDAVKVELHKCAAVALHASIEEGYGIPLVEGMAASWSVLAVDNALNREVGADTIEYYMPDAPESLAAALLTAEKQLTGPAVAAVAGRRARAARVGRAGRVQRRRRRPGRARSRHDVAPRRRGRRRPAPPSDDCGIAAYTPRGGRRPVDRGRRLCLRRPGGGTRAGRAPRHRHPARPGPWSCTRGTWTASSSSSAAPPGSPRLSGR
jgi:hypothetical protein